MALREYTDAAGVAWQVWHVVPTTRAILPALPGERRKQAEGDFPAERRRGGFALTPGMEGGWLCFESAAEKRRLAPVPEAWESCGDEELAGHLARAQPAPRRIVDGARSEALGATLREAPARAL